VNVSRGEERRGERSKRGERGQLPVMDKAKKFIRKSVARDRTDSCSTGDTETGEDISDE
jgi:hypothetical protein